MTRVTLFLMGILFHDLLLDVSYSAEAVGGAEFQTVSIRSGEGGNVLHTAEAREDYISKYEIDFSLLMPLRRKQLRNFGILRKGMAYGFRFLAPDDRLLEAEIAGVMNGLTEEIEPLSYTDGATTRFFIAKNYEDDFNSYLRWITHPSPLDDLTIEIFDLSDNLLGSGTYTGGYVAGALPAARTITISGFGDVTVFYRYGILEFASDVPANRIIKISGVYHLPVHFSSDWMKFSVDDGDLSKFSVQLEEVLPVSLGITPSMTLPIVNDPVLFGGQNVTFGGQNVVF